MFRFYANIKDAKQENRPQLFHLNLTLINGGETGQCSQQRDWDKMWIKSGNGILKRDSKHELKVFRFVALK